MKQTPNTAARPQPLARTVLAAAAFTALAAITACSSAPPRNAALDQARNRFESAQSQSNITTLAADELKRAGEALVAAEQAKTRGEPVPIVDHLAYLASQRVTIAQDTASSRAAQAITAGAAAERNRARLAERTAEADATKRQLDAAQQSNAMTAQALASSQQNNAAQAAQLAQAAMSAQDDQMRLAKRDAQVADLQAQMREINGRPTERGIVVTLGDLLFRSGQSNLQSEGAHTMSKLADFLKRNPQRSAAIEGYTDSVGSESFNQGLSDRRAQAVKDALVNLGVPSDRLSSDGFGEARPVASNSTASGRRANRRVEVVFASQAGDVLLK
jgi:outer membrane protein OmpA-like peptidoglycan-associated protein